MWQIIKQCDSTKEQHKSITEDDTLNRKTAADLALILKMESYRNKCIEFFSVRSFCELIFTLFIGLQPVVTK